MQFQNTLIRLCCFFLLTTGSGCKSRQENWLSEYAKATCAYQQQKMLFQADSVKCVTPLVLKQAQLQQELTVFARPYIQEMDLLEQEIQKIQLNYQKKYRKITDEQSQKYGHIATPAYEKTIDHLKEGKNKNITVLQSRINQIEERLTAAPKYKEIDQKVQSTQEAIALVLREVHAQHQTSINQEKNNLKKLNADYWQLI